MTTIRRKVLIVDDDESIPEILRHWTKHFNVPLEIQSAGDVGEAIDVLNQECFDCAVLDVRLPGVTGASLGALVREVDVNMPLAYLTNLDTEAVRKEAIAQRAFFLLKYRYFKSDATMCELLKIIEEMSVLNPCLGSGTRKDNHGFPRQLPKTPLHLPNSLAVLLEYGKSHAHAAST